MSVFKSKFIKHQSLGLGDRTFLYNIKMTESMESPRKRVCFEFLGLSAFWYGIYTVLLS